MTARKRLPSQAEINAAEARGRKRMAEANRRQIAANVAGTGWESLAANFEEMQKRMLADELAFARRDSADDDN